MKLPLRPADRCLLLRLGVLALCCLASAARAQSDAPAPPGASPSAPDIPEARFTLDALSQTRDRPLFSPTRRPRPVQQAALPTAPAPAPPPPGARPPQLTLVGVITSEERGAAAVVLDTASRTSFSLRAGDSYQGWTVRSLAKDGVVLEAQNQTVTLTFPTAPPGPGMGPAPVPQPDD